MRTCDSSGCDAWTDERLCYYHQKKDQGLFDVSLRRPVDPLSSEGQAIGWILHMLDPTHNSRACRRCSYTIPGGSPRADHHK